MSHLKQWLTLGLMLLTSQALDTPDNDCWKIAVDDQLRHLDSSTSRILSNMEKESDVKGMCEELASTMKQKIAFSMTSCHHWRHKRLNAMVKRDAVGCNDLLEPWSQDEAARSYFLESIRNVDIEHCISNLSDHGFLIFTEFLNHFDNLCYYYISKSWYEKVSSSVDELLYSSQKVIDDLKEASNLQREIKDESNSISKMTRLIYSDAHQLALQVERGEANIVHLIDRVSQDVMTRTRGVSDNLEAILQRTREVQSWTSDTYHMVRSVRNYAYVPLAIMLFWILSRSQNWITKFQLLACLISSLFLSLYSGLNGLVMKTCQLGLLGLSALLWLRGCFYSRSDMQVVLQEFQNLQADLHHSLSNKPTTYGRSPNGGYGTQCRQRPVPSMENLRCISPPSHRSMGVSRRSNEWYRDENCPPAAKPSYA